MKKIDEKELHELFEKMRQTDLKAYEELYKKYYNLVHNIAFSVLKNYENAEDIAQNVFVKIGNLEQEKLPKNYEASWLYTVTKNECISFIRKNKETSSIENRIENENDKNEIEAVIQNSSYQNLLGSLEQVEKQIIFLKIEAGYSFKEIAKLLKMPMGTVQWKYYKSLHSLKLLIGNLSMFIIGTITCILNKKQVKKSNINNTEKTEQREKENVTQNNNMKEENQKNYDTEQDSIKNNSKQEEISANIIAENNGQEEIKQGEQTIIETELVENRIVPKDIILYGLTSVFLFFTIFFIIISIKNQQNRKKRTSKR